ncbi:MAG: NapC/NirT family cytochrome c [Gemmobacter sp.]
MRFSLLTLLLAGFGGGIVFWGGFNTALEATNTMPFCLTCHEMREYLYEEYSDTIHYQNRTGVQATCSDCHVPREWVHKMVRKVHASRELYHWALGSIRTPERFEAKRLQLARNVWGSMKRTDSRECRNCHTIESMNPEFQEPRARKAHLDAMAAGNTCIDCHKGIAHKDLRPQLSDDEIEELEQPLAAHMREIPQHYIDGLARAEAREAEAEATRRAEIEAEAQRLGAEIARREIAAAAAEAAAAGAEAGAAQAAADIGDTDTSGIDWSGIEPTTVTMFYPGQASFEWIQGREHGGARAFTRGGERCAECHGNEVRDMGRTIVSGEKLEETPIPGKRPFVDVAVQAAHDGENLHFRFQWADGDHAPVPFAEGGKMDPENQVKLSVMFVGEGIEYGEQAGCWASCHHDARYMPDAIDADTLAAHPEAGRIDVTLGLTKYLADSRTGIEIRGGADKPRGGGLNLKPEEEIAAMRDSGAVLDLMRYLSGEGAQSGHILEQRVDTGGIEVEANGRLDGGTWTVVMSRPLVSDRPGDLSLDPGQSYTVSFALHDDHSDARFHHVSLEKRLGIDLPEAEINAAGR